MSHQRDREHPSPQPPREPLPRSSEQCPDRERPEHPTVLPREPVDPKPHPSRRTAGGK